jgi:hypothetical protein
VSIQDLELTARLVGLPLPELWTRYLSVGGNLPLQAFTERIAGPDSWSPREDLFLAVALNDALIDASLESLDPLGALVAGPCPDRRPMAGEGFPGDVRSPSGRVRPATQDRVTDIDALIERARLARTSARLIRDSTRETRFRVAVSATHRLIGHAGALSEDQPVPPVGARRRDAVS